MKLQCNIKNLHVQDVFDIYATILLILMPLFPQLLPLSAPVYKLSLAIAYTFCMVIYILFAKMDSFLSDNFSVKKLMLTLLNSIKNMSVTSWLVILYFGLTVLSAFNSAFSSYTWLGQYGRYEGVFTFAYYIAIYFLFKKHFKLNHTMWKLNTLSVWLVSFIGICESLLPALKEHTNNLSAATFGNPNFFSSYLTIFIPIFLILYISTAKKEYLVTSCITFTALITTVTTGGYLTLFLILIAILIYTLANKLPIRRFILVVLLFLCIFIIMDITNLGIYSTEIHSFAKDIAGISTNFAANSSSIGNSRGAIYKIGIDLLLRDFHYLTGIGTECLLIYFQLYKYGNFLQFTVDKIHCDYLQIAIDKGIPALVIYLFFIGCIAINLIKKYTNTPKDYVTFAIGLSIASYLIQITFNISVVNVAPTFWAILGISQNYISKKALEREVV